MPAPAFSNQDMPFPTEFLRGKAVVVAAKTTFADLANAVEIQRFDLIAAGGPLGGTRGGFIKSLTAQPRATLAACRVFLVSSLDGGATIDFRGVAPMAAYDSTLTTAYTPADFGFSEGVPRRLAAGERWWAACAAALAAGVLFQAEGDGYA